MSAITPDSIALWSLILAPGTRDRRAEGRQSSPGCGRDMPEALSRPPAGGDLSEAQSSSRALSYDRFDIVYCLYHCPKSSSKSSLSLRLLLQMFDVFEAEKLTGGFSGSLVIRVQPFEADGRPGEPCIVKFDGGKEIRTESSNSKNVFKALPDRAARMLGDAVYGRDKETNEEFGAMRLELAGACWNIPELAQGVEELFKRLKNKRLFQSAEHRQRPAALRERAGDEDLFFFLFLFQSQMLLGSVGILGDDMRPFGNVNSVLAR